MLVTIFNIVPTTNAVHTIVCILKTFLLNIQITSSLNKLTNTKRSLFMGTLSYYPVKCI